MTVKLSDQGSGPLERCIVIEESNLAVPTGVEPVLPT